MSISVLPVYHQNTGSLSGLTSPSIAAVVKSMLVYAMYMLVCWVDNYVQ